MKKKMFFICILCAVIICTLIISQVQAQKVIEPKDYDTWIVRPGDTLWKIAQVNRGRTEIRKYIYQIEKLNGIDASIYPGQEIMLP